MAPVHYFTREAKSTLTLAIPTMAGQLSQMLMGVADNVMAGRVGVVPLAAAALLVARFLRESARHTKVAAGVTPS